MNSWLDEYVDILENLNAHNIDTLLHVTAKSINFRDPFNETYTQSDFVLIMQDMFLKLPTVRFEVHTKIQQEHEAFIHWSFYGNSRMTGEFSFEGTSFIKADANGKVMLHHDFWDGSAIMQKILLLGSIIRRVRSKLAHK
ncbi:MAG: nuclear transport factor 2 family protein [Oceanospirillaceae bacterium]